jgi:hypothetical protein
MKRFALAALVAASVALPMGAARADGPCTDPVGVNCGMCYDYLGRPHPPEQCMNGNPDMHWEYCTLWFQGRCVVQL